MNNEEIMGSAADAVSVSVCEKNIGAEASVEYTLPDYLPEIRKLLHAEQLVLPATKYVNSSSAQVGGTVDIRILYVGADGGLYCAPTSADWSLNMPIEQSDVTDCADGFEMMCSVWGESVNARVTAPRRISIKCRLGCCARVFGKAGFAETLTGDVSPLSIYKKRERCNTVQLTTGISEVVELDYDVPMSENSRVVDADAKVFCSDVSVSDGRIKCRGEVLCRVLCADDLTGEISSNLKKLPFDTEIEAEGAALDIADAESIKVKGYAGDVRVNVEDGMASCKIDVVLEACALPCREAEYTSDIYSVERESESEYKSIDSAVPLVCKNANITVSERLSSADVGLEDGSQIITAYGNAVVDNAKYIDGKYIFDGNARFSVVCKNEGEYICQDIILPFKYETKGDDGAEMSSYSGTGEVYSLKASNNAGMFSVDAELALCVDCLGKNKINAVEEVTFGDNAERSQGTLIVCYPSSDDTLWSVAKRYKVAPTAINGNPETDRYLIIE